MRTGAVDSDRLHDGAKRLTGSYYLPADLPAAAAFDRLGVRTDVLQKLCVPDGIFRGPIFRRIPASAASGRPYVAPAQLERLDVGVNRYLSPLHGDLLDTLSLREGMIVVTCSGMSLGKVIWVRPDLDGLVASHDLIRIVSNPKKVHQGYLFAFLASRAGRLAIRRQIYGGSIKHIEPHHLFDLPIIRLDDAVEEEIGKQVLKAQRAIATGVLGLSEARRDLEKSLGIVGAETTEDGDEWE